MKCALRTGSFTGCQKTDWLWPEGDETLFAAGKDVRFAEVVVPLVAGRQIAIQAGGGGGIYPVRLAQDFLQVITFEISQRNLPALRYNIKDYQHISLVEAAIGSDPSLRRGIKLMEGGNCGKSYCEGPGDIPTVRLDDYKLHACDLIWLDIQGHEQEAIEGAWETITQYRPVIVLEECDHKMPYMKAWGHSSLHIRNRLLNSGYHIGPADHLDVCYLPP